MGINKYHPKLLKIFLTDELDLLAQDACYSLDKDEQINVLIVNTDKIIVEIFTDCEAKEENPALITLLDNCGYDYPNKLTKDEFWKVFQSSNIVKFHHIEVDL